VAVVAAKEMTQNSLPFLFLPAGVHTYSYNHMERSCERDVKSCQDALYFHSALIAFSAIFRSIQ
jgi:hypothetical protein